MLNQVFEIFEMFSRYQMRYTNFFSIPHIKSPLRSVFTVVIESEAK